MILVRDLLNTKFGEVSFKSVFPETFILEALQAMKDGNYGALLVIEAGSGKLVGIFSERDYARKVELLNKSARTTTVSEIMTPNPICVSSLDTVEHCMSIMNTRKFRHLPVTDGPRVLGIISIKDIVNALLSDKEALIDVVVSMGGEKQRTLERQSEIKLQKLVENVRTRLKPLSAAATRPDVQAESILQCVQGITQLIDDSSLGQVSESRKLTTRVLLANDNHNEQVIARMALAGTGALLETADTLEQGKDFIAKTDYDIVCLNSSLISLAAVAREKNQNTKTVFMTSEDADSYLTKLKEYPYLSNVVSHAEGDRVLTIKSILSTVSKIVSGDYFGMEKYLNWGADIQERPVRASGDRGGLVDEMVEYLKNMGLRRQLQTRCSNVAEELLMNAIYDAPVDEKGVRLYNNLPRTVAVELKESQQAQFRYGSDGMFLGISVRDPFGSINRETILDYWESCFKGEESSLHKDKGGGGRGLFTLLRSAHLTVFNVKPGATTEVITLFDLEPKETAKARQSSFHYFGG